MNYAYSTNGYMNYSLKKALQQISLHGYTGVEILADIPHAFPNHLSLETIIEIGKLIENLDLTMVNINANTATGYFPTSVVGEVFFEPSLCNRQKEVRNLRVDYTKKCIDLCCYWGAKNLSITSGKCLPGNPPKQANNLFKESLAIILDYAVKKDVLIGIEYEPGLLIERALEAEVVLKEMGCPNLGVNLDLGHSKLAGESLTEVIHRFNGRIWNVHIEDIQGLKHYHLIPGEGDLDFKEIIEALKDINYSRFLTVELYTYIDDPDKAAISSIAYLKKIEKELSEKCLL
jgi:fructoselysine 3-epimerase